MLGQTAMVDRICLGSLDQARLHGWAQTGVVSRYAGPAVVLANGVEYDCQAVLDGREKRRAPRSFGRTSAVSDGQEWDGRLQVESADAAWAIHEADDLRLRVTAEGVTRESGIFVDGGDLGAGELLIRGNGPIPFER